MPRPKKSAQPVTESNGSSDLGALAMRQTTIVTLPDPRFPGENRDSGYRVEIESVFSRAAHDVITGARAPLKIVKQETEKEAEKEAEKVEDTSFVDSLPEQVIAVTRRWWKEGETTDTITLNGVTMKATPENVRRVYEDPEFAWMQRRVQTAYTDLAGFFGTPKTA